MITFTDHHVYVASVVMTYWIVSISMVYLSTMLMSNEGVAIRRARLFVTWYQCVITAAICWLAGKCGDRYRKSEAFASVDQDEMQVITSREPTKPSFFAQFPKAEYNLSAAKTIFPLSLTFVGMITFQNLCLRWFDSSFNNIERSLTIVFNVFFSETMLGMSSSITTLMCLFVVILGFLMGYRDEINFEIEGTIVGVVSSLLVSLSFIFTKKVLPAADDNIWKLTYYNNIHASILFIPLMVYFEGSIILHAKQLTSGIFWAAMTLAGFFWFCVRSVIVLQIKATSPLSHNISAAARSAVQYMFAFYILGNEDTSLGVLSMFFVLGGSLAYTIVAMLEDTKPLTPPTSESEQVKLKLNQQQVQAV